MLLTLKLFQPLSKFKAIDPLLHMALEQFGKEILEGETSVKLYPKFTPSHKLTINEVKPVEQLIYATAIEHEFYQALTSMNHDIRYDSTKVISYIHSTCFSYIRT